MKKMSISKEVCLILISSIFLNGCAVVMAARQPGRKDLDVIRNGATIMEVRSELGEPVFKEEKDGLVTEVYNFKQGYSTGTKAARSLFHGAADVFTIGLWEVIGTPTEAVFHGKDMSIQAIYRDGKIVGSEILKH